MKTKQSRFAWIGAMALGLAVLLCAGILATVGQVRGASSTTPIKTVSMTYTNGDMPDKIGFTVLSGAKTLTVDESGCITLPETFSDTVTVARLASDPALDCETFYFAEYDQSAVEAGTLWAYSFTGWKVWGSGGKIAGETVFQPGFVITPELLEKHATDNGDGTASLKLTACWGKCYFIQNPYETMAYEVIQKYYPTRSGSAGSYTYSWATANITAVNTTKCSGRTAACDYIDGVGNVGNNPAVPIATVDYLYTLLASSGDPYDANTTAVMLTGDLDYIKDRNAGYTASNFTGNYASDSSVTGNIPSATGCTTVEEVKALSIPTDTSLGLHYTDSSGYLYSVGQSRVFGSSLDCNGKSSAAVTFKSLQTTAGTKYTFCYKPFNDETNLYGSMRFDNIDLDVRADSTSFNTFCSENLGNICVFYNNQRTDAENTYDGSYYFETTARMGVNSKSASKRMAYPFAYLRTRNCNQIVLCSGNYGYINISWGDPSLTDTIERNWYVGGSANCNEVYPGTVNTESTESLLGDVTITVTGGTVTKLAGGSNSRLATAEGKRSYRIYGGDSRTLTVGTVWGGPKSAQLTGDVDIVAKNCTLSAVYGGGANYSATVTGSVSVKLENTTVSGDVHGGGQYGSCVGDVSLVLSGSTVKGTVFGSGMGNINSVITKTEDGEITGYANRPGFWSDPPTGFPVMNEDYSITAYIYRELSWVSGGDYTVNGVKWNTNVVQYSFSMATVENTTILIENSSVQDVYGGGTTAVVNGDTSISITGSSTVGGNVYGGGDGQEAASGLVLYGPVDKADYSVPEPVVDEEAGTASFPNGTRQSPACGVRLGTYSWSNESYLLGEDYNGIDHTNKKVYTPTDASQAGHVLGSTTVSVADTVRIAGSVYGGGNAGSVANKATVKLSGSAVITGSLYGGGNAGGVPIALVEITGGQVKGSLYGGGNAGNVTDLSKVNISGGTVADVHGGGYAGSVYQTQVNITGGTFGGTVYGGGYEGAVGAGGAEVIIKNCSFTGKRVYGGGYEGAVNGCARVEVTDASFPDVSSTTQGPAIYGGGCGTTATVGSTVLALTNMQLLRPESTWATVTGGDNGSVYGGGNQGKVTGNVAVKITNCQIDANFYGGGAYADVGGNVTVTATDFLNSTGHSDDIVKSEYTFYGGGLSGDVAGSVTLNITRGQFDWFYGGGNQGDVGDITITLNGGDELKYVTDVGYGITYNGENSTTASYQPYVAWCFRGGGNAGSAGDIKVTMNQGWLRRNTHIGGNNGVTKSTSTVINGGRAAALFAGADDGAVLGLCYLEINDLDADGNIFGGGDQPRSRVGQTLVVINDEDLELESGKAIYGGSDQGWVMGNGTSSAGLVKTGTATVNGKTVTYYAEGTAKSLTFTGNGNTRVELNGCETVAAVFGGSNGSFDSSTIGGETEKFGNIAGRSQLKITGGTVTSAYGGNNANGTIANGSRITVAAGTVTDAYGGSNKGGVINVLEDRGTATQLVVSYDPTSGNAAAVTNAYGGSNKGGVINGGTAVVLEGGIAANAYGGSNAGGVINGGTSLSITSKTWSDGTVTSGTVTCAYGGCNKSGTVYGSLNTVFSAGTVKKLLCGGGNEAGIGANEGAEVFLSISGDADASAADTWVFGGGYMADVEIPIRVEMSSGKVYYLLGGCDSGTCVSTDVSLTGGTLYCAWGAGDASVSHVTGNAVTTLDGATVTGYLRGGGNLGSVGGNACVYVKSGAVNGHLNGGGNKGVVSGNAYVEMSGGSVTSLFGGGDSNEDGPASVEGNTYITVSGGTVGSVYGGGNRAWSTVYGSSNVAVSGGSVTTVFGGGNAGPVAGSANVAVSGSVKISENVYGGGKSASVLSTGVTLSGGTVTGVLYGGGQEGPVSGLASVLVDGGYVSTVYGGGQEGTVGTTDVQILDDACVSGNVFGGGEGADATVKGSTAVLVAVNYDFQVTETPISTTHITPSGMVHSSVVALASTEYGYIGGNVYGGGDLARVGDGIISAGGDKATISVLGSTNVTVTSGAVAGSVFGGGRGIPESGDYNFYMGAVFGSTNVLINGGMVGCSEDGGSVYGGGEQSRVYTVGGTGQACTVSIVETEDSKIAINGSVFGGGDRGESATANASVPTVYGNVDVLIQGIKDKKPSAIYFLAGLDGNATGGGVYGDGNLCLVSGIRTITLQDFEPAEDADGGAVKTFYSLQRADKAIMNNSAVVLLGAPDLVEEGDTGLYSINRIGTLSMENGSVVKLDQVVKYLGGISSDVHTDRYFIHDGTNGRTGNYDQWTVCTCREQNTEAHTCGCLEPLTSAQVENYHTGTEITHADGTVFAHTADTKNVVCVANGLYLEIQDETGTYGPVNGLFTLQLLYANPGEGGGFVYGSIPDSTGDFICETLSWKFVTSTTEVTADNFETLMAAGDGLFIRVAGKAFQRPTEFSESQTYYTRKSTEDSYMEIIDDVGGVLANDKGYTYYYWYIGGPSVTYQVDITGYIGAAATEFAFDTSLPQHDSQRGYVLYSVSVNDTLADAVDDEVDGTYELVQTKEVSGQQIAIELRLGGESLGFLVRQEDSEGNVTWGIWADGTALTGYHGAAADALDNLLYAGTVGTGSDQLTWVFHKSSAVSTTGADMEVYLDIDLYEYDGTNLENVTTGTAMLSYTVNVDIVRMTASQAMYHDNLRSYTGVATYSTIHITGNSCFTAEFQTRYVPAAYPGDEENEMVWALTTRSVTYYMCAADGAYFSVDAGGELFNLSEGLSEDDLTDLGNGTYKYTDTRIFSVAGSFSAEAIPKNTKITMVDLSGTAPAYYYYICGEEMTYIPLTGFMQMGTRTAIADMEEKPAFMTAYTDQTMAVQTERLLFVFDFEQADKAEGEFVGGVTLAHVYGGVDIMDYSKQDASGEYTRSFPKTAEYKFCEGETGVNADAYTAAFQADTCRDMETAVLRVHVEEDDDWINTLFRENGFALKIQLVDAEGNALPMPAGMYFEYKGQYYEPGPDSTFISVPVHEFGDHEILLHNPRFSLRDAVGDTAYFKVLYYSAPDERYYNAFDTGVERTASYTLEAASCYSLQVLVGQDQILASGETLSFTCLTQSASSDVTVTAWIKTDTGYTAVALDSLFADAEQTLTENAGVSCLWQIADGAQAGTYRLIFTCGNRTEYLNLIVK